MSLSIDENIASMLGEMAAFSVAAAKTLSTDPSPFYTRNRVYVIKDNRAHVSLESPLQTFDPHPLTKVSVGLVYGWGLQNAPFFVSEQGVLMIRWPKTHIKKIKVNYASVANLLTVSMVSLFFVEAEIRNVYGELVDIVAPY